MSNEVMVTVTGNAGSTPVVSRSERGTEWTQFSVASTRRVRGTDGAFYDGQTLWFRVKAWGHAASNIAESVTKGQPLVVTGRLEVDEWESRTGPRTQLVINAASVGPNLMRGRTRFQRVVPATVEPDGAPDGHGTGVTRSDARGTDPWATTVPAPAYPDPAGPDLDVAAGDAVTEDVTGPDGAGTGQDADLTA